MTDLIERLRDEQARLQRIIDKNVTVKRKRALLYRLKMAQQAADALEAAQAEIERLQMTDHVSKIDGLESDLNECMRQNKEQQAEIERLTFNWEEAKLRNAALVEKNKRLREALQAAKAMRAELAEDDGFLHSDACWNWAACESSKRQCAVCDFDDQIRALEAAGVSIDS